MFMHYLHKHLLTEALTPLVVGIITCIIGITRMLPECPSLDTRNRVALAGVGQQLVLLLLAG